MTRAIDAGSAARPGCIFQRNVWSRMSRMRSRGGTVFCAEVRAMKKLVGTCLIALLGSCGPLDDASGDSGGGAGQDEQPIIGGHTDPGDPSVAALFAHQPGATSGSLCTATVISPHALLT